MPKNVLVINVDIRETRVALIEGGIIAELHVERASTRGTLGNIILGKVTRVLPGMQAAFIDIGQERAAFLHVEDLIRPDDFEAFLAGGKREENETVPDESAARRAEEAALLPGDRPSDLVISANGLPELPNVGATPVAQTNGQAALGDARGAESDEALEGEPDVAAEADDDDAGEVEETEVEPDELDDSDILDAASPDEGAAGETDHGEASAPEETVAQPLDEGASANLTAEHVSEVPTAPGIGAPASLGESLAPAQPVVDERGPRREPGGRSSRGDGQPAARGSDARTPRSRRPRHGRDGQRHRNDRGGSNDRNGNDRGGRGGRGGRESIRLSRSTPIRDVVREGQEVIVQVSKEPIGTKGARVTSHVSLPGRYVVYMPTIDQIGISKRIGSDKERARLREAIESMKPPSGGLIVRTVAEGLTKKQLKADVGYLVRLWGDIAKKHETIGKGPALLYQELDLVLKTARDLFTDEIDQIVVDDKEQYHRLVRFIEMFMPERVKDVVFYQGEEPIFDAYGLEDEITRSLSRKVPLPSGGYLILDQAEALTAIDVNTGRFVGKGSKDLEDTLFKTNLEAVEEIAYQLRFRNLGGLIVLDLIDMEKASNREKIYRRLEELLLKDKAKTTLNRISDLGLVEMTRKRTRESLGRLLHEPCFYCDGTGQLQSKQTVAYEILRQIRRDKGSLPGYSVVVNAHPAVIDLMRGEEREAVQEAERRFQRRIELVPRKEYHVEQFDLVGR